MGPNSSLKLLAAFALFAAVSARGNEGARSWLQIQVPTSGGMLWQTFDRFSVFEIKNLDERRRVAAARTSDLDLAEKNGSGCLAGMVRVAGHKQDWREVLNAQNHACKDLGWNSKFLCTAFDPEKLSLESATTSLQDFCIDRFEYPNIPGEYPAVMASWNDAKAVCDAQAKRLCTEDEWTFACEGPHALPYPYGYDRYVDPRSHFPDHIVAGEGCNIDVIRKTSSKDENLITRLWAGVKSASRAKCVSPFGVYDLTGNVEEWTMGRDHNASVLKGGYWSPVESRCQPANRAHGPKHAFYQTGFRCCATPIAN